MLHYLIAGGPFMFATLGTSLLGLAIFLYRVYALGWGRGSGRQALLLQVMAHIEASEVSQALRLCGSDSTSLGRLLKAALQRANRSEKEIRRAVEGVVVEEIPRLRGSTVYLPQLSNLATLLGLIGTIHGLIIAFGGAGSESAATRQTILSQGISIAFYNTFFGLVVATITVIFYLLLLAKTNATLALLERSASNVIDSILWFRDSGNGRA